MTGYRRVPSAPAGVLTFALSTTPPSPVMSMNFTDPGVRVAVAAETGAAGDTAAAGGPVSTVAASTAAETVPTAARSVVREGVIFCSRSRCGPGRALSEDRRGTRRSDVTGE